MRYVTRAGRVMAAMVQSDFVSKSSYSAVSNNSLRNPGHERVRKMAAIRSALVKQQDSVKLARTRQASTAS